MPLTGRRPSWGLPVALNLLGMAGLVIAAGERHDPEVEGAYFNRTVDAPAFAGAYSTESVVPWLVGAGLAFALSTALLLRRRALMGAVASAGAAVTTLVAVIVYETDDTVRFGALDRAPQVVGRTSLTPFLVAAIVSSLIALLADPLLRRRRRTP